MTEISGIVVRSNHVRGAFLCARGMREWLRHHGFDVSDFIKNGLPVEVLEATGDEFAMRVCAVARKEFEDGR